jgi:hypothetical protein
MSDQYRLVFSAEVLEGQHPAVVKKRLAAVLKLPDERMDMLFSGKPVVIKKNIDRDNAARYQAAFKKAGAQLRVLPVQQPGAAEQPPPDTPAPSTGAPEQSGESGLQVLPVGADVLKEDERRLVEDADIDTSHLSVQGAVFNVDQPVEDIQGPNVDHITLAEVGAQIGTSDAEDIVVAELNLDFTVAEVGAIIGELEGEAKTPPVDVDSLDFDVAEPGAQMDTRKKEPPPPAPDTSHLSVDDQ